MVRYAAFGAVTQFLSLRKGLIMCRSCLSITCLVVTFGLSAQPHNVAAEGIPDSHRNYAQTLWNFLDRDTNSYRKWSLGNPTFDFGPPSLAYDKSYLNSHASASIDFPYGSCVVTEHYSADEDLQGVTVRLRVKPDYDKQNKDWYWAHFLADGTLETCSAEKNPFAKRGFVVRQEDGRLWVFRVGSPELAEFLEHGEPAKVVIRPAAGPDGMTVKSPDADTVDAYLQAIGK